MSSTKAPFYITTPIYYVNDKPHLGSAYSTIVADVMTRYHRYFGDESFFLTGVDEHGQKVQQAAEKRGLSPQQHCDEMSQVFRVAWQALGIHEDFFFRTTDDFHKRAVQGALQSLFDKGEIYADTYEGWYSVSDEIFYTEKELINGKTPDGKDVVKVHEKNYFFRMSKYQNTLIKHIEDNPKFIQPDFRRNEVLGFLRKPLADLCISRPKTRLSWGIEIPFDRDYVTYVWFDALLNYATAVGYQPPQNDSRKREQFAKWWTSQSVHHLIGKDIIITHSVYWPPMLMALDLPLPKTIFAHGWILNKDNEKMSKSKGSVMDPLDLIQTTGVDPLRYFLIHDIPLGQDAPVSHELIFQRINTDLANNLGNLVSRTNNLVHKYFSGKVPPLGALDGNGQALSDSATGLSDRVRSAIEDFRPSEALRAVTDVLNQTNKYLELRAPWKAAKEDLAHAGTSLKVALEVLRIVTPLLAPVMPEKCGQILKAIGATSAPISPSELKLWNQIPEGTLLPKVEPIFPRIT
jgi:methionyl-tRNA synthetase